MKGGLVNFCLCCSNKSLITCLELKDTPLTDDYSRNPEESKKKEKFPIIVKLCEVCGHLQLDYQVPPEKSYKNYLYNSKITTGLNKSFVEYANSLMNYGDNDFPKFILDVGSNDGSFLEACTQNGFETFGIEPAGGVAEWANKNGRKTINCYFDENTKDKLRENNYPVAFDFITFNNVLANISDPGKSLILANKLLKNDSSTIVVQTGYHPILFTKGLFDYIYHEHFSYFTISSMSHLCKRVGLKIIDYEINNIRCGTVRFFIQRSNSLKEPLKLDLKERFGNKFEMQGLKTLVNASKVHVNNLIKEYKKQGFKVIGYGASHSTGILAFNLEITELIDYLVDENTQKIGLFMPGTSLEVKSIDKLYQDKKTVVIILAWQYFETIRNKLIENNFSGNIIKPILP